MTLLLGLPAIAQIYPNGLVMDSVDPAADSIFIKRMRHRMDSIRIAEKRPTVALVLSGGGAKGAAHLGAKELIDEIGIPVDMICGTSIGGLVGGLLAVGYTPEFIDSLFTHQDWEVILSDKVDLSYISVDTKMYRSKYLISIPFHYRKDTFDRRIREQEKYAKPEMDGKLHLGANEDDYMGHKGLNTTASSLPAGYANGFNVNNLIASLTVGYQDSLEFSNLPIPFFCVAADIISCKPKNWGNGNLKSAMRSTMSIPGLFNPVREQGMVLVDGGVRNNFPVDLARAMGADYVIGVDLHDRLLTYSEVNNVGNMFSQFIDMMGKESLDRNVRDCDILIRPDLEGYNMLSFRPEAIDTIMSRGRKAAMERYDELRALKEKVGDAGPYLSGRPAIDINRDSVMVNSIVFEGISDRESRYLQKKTGLVAGQHITAADVNDAMSVLQATGCFESVTYSMLGPDEPYRLVFKCVQGPVHQLGLGVRADNVEWVSLMLNLGLNTHKLMGSKLDCNLKFGPTQSLDLRYSLDLLNAPTINADFKIAYNRTDVFFLNKANMDIGFWTHRERLYLSHMKWTRLNVNAGVANHFFKVPSSWLLSYEGPGLAVEQMQGNYGYAFVNAGLYTMDDLYYPMSGTDFNVKYDFVFAKSGRPDFIPKHIFALNWKPVFSIGERFAIIPDVHLRAVFNGGEQLADRSLGLSNYVGGGFAGRYFDQTVPMAGLSDIIAADDMLAVLNLAFRISPLKDFYISAEGGLMRTAETFGGMFETLKPDNWGTSLGVGYDSVFGPLKLSLDWNQTRGLGYYLSLGYDF